MFALTVAALFGALIGSFLIVCIHRLPRGASIVWPGSACPGCGRASWFENIPIVSYAFLAPMPDVRPDFPAVSDRRSIDGGDVALAWCITGPVHCWPHDSSSAARSSSCLASISSIISFQRHHDPGIAIDSTGVINHRA
jgi:hypothetical protein